jgi:hypothetical protein
MSFRLFVYYCAVCGGLAAFAGWGLGRWVAPESDFGAAVVQGTLLGLTVALALALVHAIGNRARISLRSVARPALGAVVVGGAGGLLGAIMGQSLVDALPSGGLWQGLAVLCGMLGWTIVGAAIGVSLHHDDTVSLLRGNANWRSWLGKIRPGLVGGAAGGLVGGALYLVVKLSLEGVLGKEKDYLSPSAVGFVTLGISVGLLIGLAQILFRAAWLRVESGRRTGRELVLGNSETTIGRGRACDLDLPGDAAIERIHARIRRDGPRFVLADNSTPGGTYLNDELIADPQPLVSGDVIRVGSCTLRFHERQSGVASRDAKSLDVSEPEPNATRPLGD